MNNYMKVSSYEGRKGEIRKVVLLYSGGLDTSVMLKWIQDEYQAEVIALTIDIGQQADNLEEIR
ncbi:argininosuccinate synthase, partial [bacterium]|nr:argininosuccinate synthase [bacterium]